MKCKNSFLIISFIGIFFISMFSSNVNMNAIQNNGDLDKSTNMDDYKENIPKLTDIDNTDRRILAEDAAQWLRDKWILNKWNESDDYIELGQSGVAGIGEFFIDMYNTTSDPKYRQWASEVGTWLISQHPVSYIAGKWPNKIGTNNILNYTSYLEGSAGIGSFFARLYSINQTSAFKTEAENVGAYLNSLKQTTPSGTAYAWKDKDELSLTAKVIKPSSNTKILGTNSTNFNNLLTYDSLTYDINSVTSGTQQTDVSYAFRLSDAGIIAEDLSNMNDFMTDLSISLTIQSNESLSSKIRIYNYLNSSWATIGTDAIGTSESLIQKTYLTDFLNFTQNGQILIRINTTDSNNHKISIDSFNITIDYNNRYNSSTLAYGAAGIGSYYLDMYKYVAANNIYLVNATGAANFTLEQAIIIQGKSAWNQKGLYYTGIQRGAAGIGRFLLDMYNITANSNYRNAAIQAAEWLISCNASLSGSYSNNLIISFTNNTSTFYSGMDYLSGIGQFLLELGQLGYNKYIINATYIANFLIKIPSVASREIVYQYDYLYYKWRNYAFSGTYEYSYSTATAGVLEFLYNLFDETGSYGEYLSGGIEWIKGTINVTTNYWAGNRDLYSISNGLAGIASALLKIDVSRPEITYSAIVSQFEYDEDMSIYFTVDSDVTSISYVNISYSNDINALWNNYQNESIVPASCTHVSGNTYKYKFTNIKYGTTLYYVFIAKDANNIFSLDSNDGAYYSLDVEDNVAPLTQIIPSWDEGLGAGEDGIITIKVQKEPKNGAPFDHIRISIPELSKVLTVMESSSDFDLIDGWYTYEYDFDGENTEDAVYGDTYNINVRTYDVKGNTRDTAEKLSIIDNLAPEVIEINDAFSSWIPQFTEVEVSAKFEDVGSGIDDKKGVFVLYSIDEGKTWSDPIYLEKSGNKYVGTLPGQVWLAKVYYVFGAEDKEGNYAVYDKFLTAYEDVSDMDIEAAFSYSVTINWIVVLIVIGIIAAIAVIGYAIYSKKGGYLEKMRRTAKYTATGIAIKERLTNFYYKLYDKFNAIGEKLMKAGSGGFGKFGLWLEDHIGEKPRKFFRSVGRFIYGIPLGIWHGIKNFFKGIGRLFSKSKGWQVVVFMLFGILFMLTTVIQFIMEGGYPLRAVFFVNLGFLMVILSIATFIIKGIYKLTYK